MQPGDFFQLVPVPLDEVTGVYNLYLVVLSYLMACLASFVALDNTERIRVDVTESVGSKAWWLISGALAMGCGIWTMHFIGMQAFIMSMPMQYDPIMTLLSLVIAVVASGFAFYLITNSTVHIVRVVTGGILLGLGICSMHYVGMAAMENVHIRYLPGLFVLSVVIAILTSETALYLMIMGSKRVKHGQFLKLSSALVMGLAICGMHYTGMFAAVFTMVENHEAIDAPPLTPNFLSLMIAGVTVLVMSIALVAGKYWVKVLQSKKLLETEAILRQKSLELSKLAESSMAKEERIRAILTAAGDGIIVTDEQGVIEMCNRAAESIFNDSISNIVGQNVVMFFNLIDNKNQIDFNFFKKNLLIQSEFICIRRTKETKPVELTISQSSQRSIVSYIIVFRDIEERKLADKNLASLNQQLISTARLAGMAEVATSVLHNVGNVLNSINVSSRLLLERDNQSKITGLAQVAKLLEQHRSSLENFLREDPIGQKLPEYLSQYAEFWNKEWSFMHNELELLNNKVQHIKDIVKMQQSLGGQSSVIEKVQLIKLLEDSIAINAEGLEKYGIAIIRDYDSTLSIETDRVKIVQILVNLVKNAIEALVEGSAKDKVIVIKVNQNKLGYVQIEVSDNGKGIQPENLTKIFSYGFTTKKFGHGLGLHSSSLTAQDVGGGAAG